MRRCSCSTAVVLERIEGRGSVTRPDTLWFSCATGNGNLPVQMGRVGNTGTQRNVQSQLDKNAVVSCELCCATSSTGHIDQQLALASRPSSFGAPLKDVHIVAYVAYAAYVASVAHVGADRCLHKLLSQVRLEAEDASALLSNRAQSILSSGYIVSKQQSAIALPWQPNTSKTSHPTTTPKHHTTTLHYTTSHLYTIQHHALHYCWRCAQPLPLHA